MTQKEYEARIAKIMEQEEELGLKIELHPIDKDHLDCIWYSGEVGRITRKDGWAVVLEAHGEIRLYGTVNGEELDFVDKGCGSAYQRLNIKDDEELRRLEDKGKITFEDNNWFEYDVLDPDGNFYDCGFIFDNVMDNNILDCFEGLGEDWLNEAIDFFKNEKKGGKQTMHESNKELKCVWILTHSWAGKFGDDMDEPRAFMQKETAKRVFNEIVDGYKEEKPLFEGDTVIEEDEDENMLDFYAYEEGYAAGNNVHVNLHRCIIED